MCIDHLKERENARSSALRQFGYLRVIDRAGQGAAFEAGRRIPKRLHHGVETVPLGPPLPRGNNGPILGAVAEKPELFGRVLVLVGLAEGIAIYGLIVSILILNRVA